MKILDKHFKNKKDKSDFFIALIVIALFLAGILCAVFCGDTESELLAEDAIISPISADKNSIAQTSDELTSPNNRKEVALEKEGNLDTHQESQINSWVDSLQTKDVKNTPVLENNNSEVTLEIDENAPIEDDNPVLEEEIVEEKNNSLNEENTEIEENEVIEENTLLEGEDLVIEKENQIIEEEKIETTEEIAVPSPQKIEETLDTKINEPSYNNDFSTKACVIMIGAFVDGDNAAAIIDRLQAEEFVVYSSYRKGYRTVGIRSSCDKITLNSNLKKMKKDYAKDAFIIK